MAKAKIKLRSLRSDEEFRLVRYGAKCPDASIALKKFVREARRAFPELCDNHHFICHVMDYWKSVEGCPPESWSKAVSIFHERSRAELAELLSPPRITRVPGLG